MEITAAHWIYLIGIIIIITVTVMRKNVLVPAVAATFLTAWAFSGNLATALSSVFNASLSAASELFNIFLIIALMTSLLGVLSAMGADKLMVKPFQRFMRNGTSSFLVIFVITYFVSLFFWPTPAVPLIGAILLPAAIRAGLPAMAGAMAIAIAGQGMALSSDYIIQVAPGLSAAAAGADVSTLADRALVLSLITGLVAAVIVFMRIRSQIVAPDDALLEQWERAAADGTVLAADDKVLVADRTGGGDERGGGISVQASGRPGAPKMSFEGETPGAPVKRAKAFALIVPLVFLAVVIYMVLGKFTDLVPETSGGAAAGLVGGTAALLMLIAAMTLDGRDSLQSCATHVVDGLVFAFKAMGVVIPIAGFFFIGNSDFAGKILSLGEEAEAPSFLSDLVLSTQHMIPDAPIVMGIGMLLIGMATGLEGSGFSGLPLTGSLSGTLGPASGVDVETLAAIGQMGSVWTGGGVLIAWSSLLAVAGFARVSVLELARQLFIPVVAGLLISTIIAVLIF
jgi:hypothetical protein